VILLAYRFARPELQDSLPVRFLREHAGANVLLGLQGEVLFYFLAKPIVVALPGDQVAEAREETADAPDGLCLSSSCPIHVGFLKV